MGKKTIQRTRDAILLARRGTSATSALFLSSQRHTRAVHTQWASHRLSTVVRVVMIRNHGLEFAVLPLRDLLPSGLLRLLLASASRRKCDLAKHAMRHEKREHNRQQRP